MSNLLYRHEKQRFLNMLKYENMANIHQLSSNVVLWLHNAGFVIDIFFCFIVRTLHEYEILSSMQHPRNLLGSSYDSRSNDYFSCASSDNRRTKKYVNDNTCLYWSRKLVITERRSAASTVIVKSVNVAFCCLQSKKRRKKRTFEHFCQCGQQNFLKFVLKMPVCTENFQL